MTTRGLSTAEVESRISAGRDNRIPSSPGRTVGQIIRANVCTPVNGIVAVLLVAILVSRPGPDALFAGVVVGNTLLGITQELRAKRVLERLAVLNAPHTRVLRDGVVRQVPVAGVVADDILELSPGDQVPVDGVVVTDHALELNESLLSGESEPVVKEIGDAVLSGSFVVAGSGRFRATGVGTDSYANDLAEQAKRFQLAQSELRTGADVLLRWLSWIIPPISILLLLMLLRSEQNWQDAVRGTVAAAVAIVPDGLVLLTSVCFIVGILGLARHRVLARELAAVELLARVDVLCLDKTGTITTGEIALSGLEPIDSMPMSHIEEALRALAAAEPTPNATLRSLATRYPDAPPGWEPIELAAFSAARRWSGVTFDGRGTFLLGAPEVLSQDPGVLDRLGPHTATGSRVMLLAWSPEPLRGNDLPSAPRPVGFVIFQDQVRPDAADVLAHFVRQGVAIKIISGDHPSTVAAIAREAGVPGAGSGIDASELGDDPAGLAGALERHSVFGRVTPHQKQAMVAALHRNGHVVAMTGDGVNDVLALKDADMGIAMGSGSDAARAVAEIVLLDDRLATLPVVLATGRRVTNNIERVANLFAVKATYAVVFAALTIIFRSEFPFLPRHLALTGVFNIGVPGFVLALMANERRSVPGFLPRVLRFSLPAGLVVALPTFAVYGWARHTGDRSLEEARTMATLVLLGTGLAVLARLARPLRTSKVLLIAAMVGCYLIVLSVPGLREFFYLEIPSIPEWAVILGAIAGTSALLDVGPRLVGWWGEADRLQSLGPAEAPTR